MNIPVYVALLVTGLILGYLLCVAVIRTQRRRAKRKKQPQTSKNGVLRSITRLIFVTTQISALVWVFTSYGIAIYSTVCLEQVYTMAELSEPAIHTILGVGFLKVLENIFEHNSGPVFGQSTGGTTTPNNEGGV